MRKFGCQGSIVWPVSR